MKIAFYFLISAALLSAARADDQLPNPVVAKGKNFEFRQSDLDEAFIAFRANIAALGERIPEGTRSTLEAQLLDEMIFTRLLVDKSNDADRAKARETANELLDKVRSRSSSEDIFRMRLRALGLSVEQFEKQVVDQALRREVLRRLMSADIRITDEQIRSYYETNTAQFSEPEKVRASHILLATVNKETRQPVSPDIRKEKETTIRKLEERAESGAGLSRTAEELSEEAAPKTSPGSPRNFPKTPAPRTKAANTRSAGAKWSSRSKLRRFRSNRARSATWWKPSSDFTSSRCTRKFPPAPSP